MSHSLPAQDIEFESPDMLDENSFDISELSQASYYPGEDLSAIENWQEDIYDKEDALDQEDVLKQENFHNLETCTPSQKYVDDESIIANFVEPPVTSGSSTTLSSSSNPLKRKRVESTESLEIGPLKHLKISSTQSSTSMEPANQNVHVIVHCMKIEALMRKFNLARGVRYELARLISKKQIKQSDVTESALKQLQGSNEEAVPKINRVFSLSKARDAAIIDPAFAKEVAAYSPWKELDIEDAALSRGPYEGLGNNPAMPNWYGGKIQFRGRLYTEKDSEKDGPKKRLKLALDNLSLGSSCRFTRRFGSWSFIRVKIPGPVYYDKSNHLLSYFSQPFVIWDAVFRACYAKGDNVFLYMTNEVYPSFQKVEGRLSVEGFITWHMPLSENRNQLMTKWSSRMVLGFSNSVPGPRLEEGSILPEEDVVSAEKSDMTDGCGLSTRKIHHEISLQLRLPVFPTAFQFRVAGCKGMSLISEDPQYKDDRKIWVRPSQTKIRYPQGIPSDPAMLTIDLLRTPHMRCGTRLSNDMVINLAENGVPSRVFVNLFKLSLDELFKSLTTWEGPEAMFDLYSTLEKIGGVLAGRRAREAVGEARVRGYSNRSPDEMEEDAEDEDDIANGVDAPKSVAWWNDQTSGCPSGLEETAMDLLNSGFRPQESQILREKLKQVTKNKIEHRVERLGVEIEQSCIAFAVPDPYGVLGENEIQIKSSSYNLKLEDGTLTDVITGDVLIGRNPTKNPCDIRKVKAVEHPQLRNFVDVIVCSIQGMRRLIDFLAGGDYDGDTLVAIWLHSIVSSFKNADEKYSLEPKGLDICFKTDKETVGHFIERTETWTSEKRIEAMQIYLLGGLCDPSLVGKYSAMHDIATYTRGYQNPRTIKLNAKFCTILDSSKNGRRIKPETLREDTKEYSHPLGPRWKTAGSKKKGQNQNQANATYPTRDLTLLPPFIMDILVKAAEKESARVLKELDVVFAELTGRRADPHLIEPWLAAQSWARRGSPECVTMKEKELELIAAHVQDVFRRHNEELRRKSPSNNGSFTDLRIETRQDFLRKYSREFQSGPSLDLLPNFVDHAMLSRIRASYAYKYDSEKNYRGWSRFPWNVDLRQLCAIKAPAVETYKVVTTSFYERFKLVNWK